MTSKDGDHSCYGAQQPDQRANGRQCFNQQHSGVQRLACSEDQRLPGCDARIPGRVVSSRPSHWAMTCARYFGKGYPEVE